jgi:hypothetical protein
LLLCSGTAGSQLTGKEAQLSGVHTRHNVICGSVSIDPRFGEFHCPSDTKQFTWWMFCWMQGV